MDYSQICAGRDIISPVLQVYTGSPEYTDEMYAIPSLLDIDASTDPGDYYCTTGGLVTVNQQCKSIHEWHRHINL